MKQQRRWALVAGLALMTAFGVVAAGLGTADQLQAVRVDRNDAGQPVVTLQANGELDFESFVLDGPDRLVLDLRGVVNRLDGSRWPVGAAGVSRVRASQHVLEPVPVTRVVVDLERAVDYRILQDGVATRIEFGTGMPRVATAAPAEPQAAEQAPEQAAEAETVEVADLVAELEARNPEPEPAPEPVAAAPAETTAAEERPELDLDRIDQLLKAPAFAAPAPQQGGTASGGTRVPSSFESRRILTDEVQYTGKRISLNLVDADIKQVFRLFHELSGINFVLDPGVTGRVTIVLDQVPWDQALDIILKNNGLDKVLENNVLRIASTQKLAQEAAARKQLKDAKELEVEPITLTRTLSYAKADEVERVIREGGVLSQRGRVIVDERTNTLIISDVPKKVEPLDQLISTLDAETPQVMIEARIVETSRDFTQQLGVNWGFTAIADNSTGTGTGLDFPANASVDYSLNLPGGGGESNLGFSFGNIIDSFTLDVTLNTLERTGEGRILSSPRIATQNNERAEIEQGVRIPIVNTTATEIDVEFVSASLRLIVTPQITAEGTIILEVEVENNSPDFNNAAADIPAIATQRAQTKVLISDGGTTVIGGIFTVNEGRAEEGVPWFRKLPVFGWLFKTQEINIQNRELLIFITPKIVKLG